jgi:predicted MFS family arabinose efflux permease
VTRTRRTGWLLAGVFAWFGALFGSLAISVLDVQTALGVGPGALGALLAIGFAIGACAQLGGGVSVERRGPMGALRFVVALMAGALAVVACAPSPALLAVGVLLVLTVAGALNATANACAVGVVTTDVRGFVRFHACYSAGAMSGALTGAAIESAGGSWRLVWGWWSVVGLALAVAVGRVSTAAPSERPDPPSLRSLARLLESPSVRDLALLLCAAVAAASAVDTWGVRFLRVERGASIIGGAGAYALAQVVAFVARLRLVPSSDARRSGPIVIISVLLAAGLVLESCTSIMWIGAVGLTLAAVAGALLIPLLLARCGLAKQPADEIAVVGAVGQLGFVIGPALVGAATSRSGSSAGLLAAALLAVVTALGVQWRLSGRTIAVDGVVVVDDSESVMSGRVDDA